MSCYAFSRFSIYFMQIINTHKFDLTGVQRLERGIQQFEAR
jgi:hypothetical protein